MANRLRALADKLESTNMLKLVSEYRAYQREHWRGIRAGTWTPADENERFNKYCGWMAWGGTALFGMYAMDRMSRDPYERVFTAIPKTVGAMVVGHLFGAFAHVTVPVFCAIYGTAKMFHLLRRLHGVEDKCASPVWYDD